MTTEYGPCEDWPVEWVCTDDLAAAPELTGAALATATEILWALSGRQFGLCEVTLRPCRRDCVDAAFLSSEMFFPSSGDVGWPYPALLGGRWVNLACGGCGDDCSCSAVSEVILPGPVHDIVEVLVDGIILADNEYRLDDSRRLVRLGAQWPTCNDLNLDDDQPGTWSVTANYGRDVPESGKWAVGELACQLLKAMRGEDCRLPNNVVSLARQGVTIKFPDINELFARGRTGLYLVDIFLAAFNPNGLQSASRVYSVDSPRARRTGTDVVPGP